MSTRASRDARWSPRVVVLDLNMPGEPTLPAIPASSQPLPEPVSSC